MSGSYFHSLSQYTLGISFVSGSVSGTLPGTWHRADKSACPQGAHSNNDAVSPREGPCHPDGRSLPALCPSAPRRLTQWHLPRCVLLAYLMSVFCISHTLQEGQGPVLLNIICPGPQTVLSTQQLLNIKRMNEQVGKCQVRSDSLF